MRNDVDATRSPSGLERVCESCLVPSLPSNRKDINVRRRVVCVLPSDVDAHPLPSEPARVCESCLVPRLPSNRKDTNVRILVRNDVDAHLMPSEPARVCESCLVPSLPSNRKDRNVRTAYLVMWTRIPCRAGWKEFAKAA